MQVTKDMLEIDINRLDQECVDHPKLYFEVSSALTDVREKYERFKLRLDIQVGELKLDIIRNPQAYEVEKTPEYVIDSLVNRDPRIIEIRKEMHKLKAEIDTLQAGVNSLEHKKRMIESLVTLHGNQYFASPRTSSAGMEEINNRKTDRVLTPKKR